MKQIVLLFGIFALVLSGCAQSSDKIQASYVSPLQYQSFSCRQLSGEMARVSRKVSEVSGVQDKQASNDSAAMGVGLIIFWPALFFLIGEDQKAELSRLKGEYDALEQTAIQKDCGFVDGMQKQRKAAQEAQKAQEEAAKIEASKKKNWNN